MDEDLKKYNSDEWREVEILLDPSGKAPKKYGEHVYRFSASLTLSVIMPRRGWSLIKKAKNYVYLKPSDHEKPPFSIKIRTPNKEQALEIAQECFVAGRSWMGQIGEWPAWYLHKRQQHSDELIRYQADKWGIVEKLDSVYPVKSNLHIGQFGVWSVELTKVEDGDFNFHEYGNIASPFENNLLGNPHLLEGKALDVEQTEYERNPEARRRCIEHYGTACQVCGFHFGQVFGDIGAGFIHVHHIKPISMQGGQDRINPITDLVPLCPNCHAMAHRRTPPYSIDELKRFRKTL